MWFLPTWNRPDQCARVLQTCIDTGVSTPGLVFVQGAYGAYGDLPLPNGWTVHYHGENIGLSAALDWFAEKYRALDWYGFITDDHFPLTQGWDRQLIEQALPHYIAHSSDGWQSDQRIFGITCFGGDLLRAMGHWAVPGTWHCFNDDLWEAIGRDFGVRRYVKAVECFSPHCMKGDAPVDDTYRSAYRDMPADQRAYEAFMGSHARTVMWRRIGETVRAHA
jgi:hypothetical protein